MARNTSADYVQQLKGNRKYALEVTITYLDGIVDTITDLQDFMKLKVEDACSGTSKFEIGAAIINEAVVVLNNRSEKFKFRSFQGATVSIMAGIYVNGTPELLDMGTYIVTEPVALGATINIVAYDNMVLADSLYTPSIQFPATIGQIANDACVCCGLTLKTLDFQNSDYVVDEAPEGTYTCREILSFIGQISGCFARCDAQGYVEYRWYDTEVSHELDGLMSRTICTDQVTVTEIDVHGVTAGEEGYKLSIQNNPLILKGKEQVVADYLASKMIGLSFRPMNITCRNDASIEAGDRVKVTDEKGNEYETLVTSTTFVMMGEQTIECNAESPVVNSSNRLDVLAKAMAESNRYTDKQVEKEISEREKALAEMSQRIAESSGLYMTQEKQEDGTTIYYGHDKQSLEESTIIWKFGLEAIGISTDGGKTYPYGLDISGTATLNRIYTVGLNADYITSGTFVAKDADGQVVFSVNVETGEVYIKANDFSVHTVNTDKGILITKINGDNWNARYIDANEREISSLYFDFEKEQFIFNGAGHFTGSINVNDKFIVDVNGNVNIYGGKYYAMDDEGNISGFTTMDKDGFTVYSKESIPVIKIGYPSGNMAYPYVRLNSADAEDEEAGIVKKFANGMWMGNDAPADAYGEFYARDGYNGIFVSFEDGTTYVVNGTDMQSIYTGESIARFG